MAGEGQFKKKITQIIKNNFYQFEGTILINSREIFTEHFAHKIIKLIVKFNANILMNGTVDTVRFQ